MSIISHHHHHPHKSHKNNHKSLWIIDPSWDQKNSINGEWKTSLFSCCDFPNECIFGLCFPCIIDCEVVTGIGITRNEYFTV